MKLFLHIGVEKTGTTSIQKFFLINRTNLIDQKIYFPDDSELVDQRNGCSVGLPLFTDCESVKDLRRTYNSLLLSGINQEEYQNKFEKSLKCAVFKAKDLGCHSFFLSDEHLSSRLDTQEIKIIHKLLNKYFSEISILVYLREQPQAIRSLYSTYVMYTNAADSEIDFLSTNYARINFQFDYKDILLRWENEFTESRIIPRLYSKDVTSDVMGQVCENFNDISKSFSLDVRTNISLNNNQRFLKRLLNKTNLENNIFPLSLILFKVIGKLIYLLGFVPEISYFNNQHLANEISNFDNEIRK